MSVQEKRRRVYPGVTGLYSDEAWARAELFTDGHITDGILQSCEFQVDLQKQAEERERLARERGAG